MLIIRDHILESYLQEYRHPINLYTVEVNSSSFSGCHYLPINPQGEAEPHESFPSSFNFWDFKSALIFSCPEVNFLYVSTFPIDSKMFKKLYLYSLKMCMCLCI